MNTILQNLQNMLGQNMPGQNGRSGANSVFSGLSAMLGGGTGSGVSKLLGPAAIGGILGALLTSKTARSIAGGAILAGGGALLWDKYKNRLRQEDAQSAAPLYGKAQFASPEDRSLRLVRAMVFAARSDGHIDEAEGRAISEQIAALGLGADGEALINKALNDPLDPAAIAEGVHSEEEALELFTLSRAVVIPDQFMEKNYLETLAKALHIPDDVRDGIMKG